MKRALVICALILLATIRIGAQANTDKLDRELYKTTETILRSIVEQTIQAIRMKMINDDGKDVFTKENPALVSNIPGFRDTIITANIALGDSCTQTLNLGNRRLKTIYMPAAWDAANLTVRVSPDNVTWYNYYSDDVELTIATGASYAINVNPRVFIGIQYIQLRSGTSAADVDQTAARILKLKIGNY